MTTKIEKRIEERTGKTVPLSSMREALILLCGAVGLGVALGWASSPGVDEKECRAFCAGVGAPLVACSSDGMAVCMGEETTVVHHVDGTVVRMSVSSSSRAEGRRAGL